MADPLQQSILDERFDDGPQTALRRIIFNSTDDRYSLESFFANYDKQCLLALGNGGRYCSARVHQDVVDIMVRIKAAEPVEQIRQTLQHRLASKDPPLLDETMAIRTIELAARVISMHDIGTWRGVVSGRGRLHWDRGKLGDCLALFHAQSCTCDATGRVETLFDIVAVEKLAQIKVTWTSNLVDHLRLCDNGRDGTMELSVFHQATFLKMMMEDEEQSIFPADFLSETLITLALLFPHKDKVVRRWFKHKQSAESEPLDWEVLSCGRLLPSHRRLERFTFWRERLSDLRQTFDEAEPGTPYQWWIDRRKRAQWSTFWVAVLVLVLTIVFGLIQCIEGAMQVYKAYYPRD